jgi:2-octaprenylphenol hydroxylase
MKNIVIYGDGIIGKLTAVVLSDFFNVYLIINKKSKSLDKKQARYFSINLLSKFMFLKYRLWDDIKKNSIIGYDEILTWHESLSEDILFRSRDIAFDKLGYIVKDLDIIESLDNHLSAKKNIFKLDSGDSDEIDNINTVFNIKSDHVTKDFLKHHPCRYNNIVYDQKALVMNLSLKKGISENIALQRFDKNQIQGMLPISNNQYNLIWSANSSFVDELEGYNNTQIINLLNKNFKGRVSQINDISSPITFPLTGFNSTKYILDNFVLIGGAAHSIHPMAGLGLNMGIQDIYFLQKFIKVEGPIDDALSSYERSCIINNNRFFRTINFLMHFFTGGRTSNIVRSKSLLFFNKNKFLKDKAIKIATGLDVLELESESKDQYCKPSY